MDRRTMLRLMGAAAGGALLTTAWPKALRAAPTPWGTIPAGILPTSHKPLKVLEIYLYGGLSPWETFYLRRDLSTQSANWREFDREWIQGLKWLGPQAAGPLCKDQHQSYALDKLTKTFDTTDGPAGTISLGPATKPIWPYSDQMRVFVLQHDLLPHEAAIPFAATGFRLGRPQFCGLGAAIQENRMALDRARQRNRVVPYAYFLDTYERGNDNLAAFTATGLLSASSRPVRIQVGGLQSLTKLLQRTEVDHKLMERLMAQYAAQYSRALETGGTRPRSKGLATYEASVATLLKSNDLEKLLTDAKHLRQPARACVHVSTASPMPGVCKAPDKGSLPKPPCRYNNTRDGLEIAASLLANKTNPAHYVGVVDGGLITADGGGGYDTHDFSSGLGHAETTAVNLWNTLASLAALIERGEDKGGIDLDTTLVVLNTEFGRTPFRSKAGERQANSVGRDHWPHGYVNVLIGGLLKNQQGKRVLGRIGDSQAAKDANVAVRGDVYSPTDLRAAILLAAGVYPFADNLFGVGDFSHKIRNGKHQHSTIAVNLATQLLGLKA